MRSIVVVGNPRPASRTRRCAELVVRRLTGEEPAACLELAELGPRLLGSGDPAVAAATRVVATADLAVFASPTYKATYTGLLQLFLEQFGAGELTGLPAVALMLGGAPQHALAGERALKPVLSEIGCSCPAPALFVLEATWDRSPELDTWLPIARRCHRIAPPVDERLPTGEQVAGEQVADEQPTDDQRAR